jgi:1,4-dihydroxy-2-naphthoate octaprenyltransferase
MIFGDGTLQRAMSPKTIAITSVALIILGCVVAAIFTATALDAIGITIAGIGLVGLVSAAFYAIGLSEDRAREHDASDPSR